MLFHHIVTDYSSIALYYTVSVNDTNRIPAKITSSLILIIFFRIITVGVSGIRWGKQSGENSLDFKAVGSLQVRCILAIFC